MWYVSLFCVVLLIVSMLCLLLCVVFVLVCLLLHCLHWLCLIRVCVCVLVLSVVGRSVMCLFRFVLPVASLVFGVVMMCLDVMRCVMS